MTRARREGALLCAAAIATVLPLFVVELLPFTDVPEHLAVMASLRHWLDPAFRIPETYELAIGRSQYLLYHLAGAGLAFALGVDGANRLLLAAAGIAQPFAMRALLRSLDRDERLALFAAPLFWNRALVLGFLPFVASLPVLVFTLALVVRQLDAPTRRRAAAIAALAVVLFYLHASAFLLLAVIGGALALLSTFDTPRALRARVSLFVRRVPWLAPAAVVTIAWALLGRITLHGASLADEGEIGRINAFRSVRAFSLWAHDVFKSHGDEACAIAYWAAFLLLLAIGLKAAPDGKRALRLLTPFACVLALYFLLPFRVGAAAMLNVRMAPVLAMFALLPLEVPRRRLASVALAIVTFVTFATAANAAIECRAMVREEAAGVTALFEKTRPGSRLVTLPFDASSRHAHFPPFIHMGAYHRVRNGGVSSFSFSELAHWSLHYRPEAAPPKKPQGFWSLNPCVFKNAEDGPYYDYALVKGRLNPFRDRPPGPAWRIVDRVKDFTLYEKIEGETWPSWNAPDPGPCGSRATAEAKLGYGSD